jgi:hypothetical protein
VALPSALPVCMCDGNPTYIHQQPSTTHTAVDSLIGMAGIANLVPAACQESLFALAACASDYGEESPATSLSTSDGCCLKECADGIQQVKRKGG